MMLSSFLTSCSSISCDEEPALIYAFPPLERLSFPFKGSGQGIQVIGDKIYLYGDDDTGLVQELDMDLQPTGWEGHLTYNNEDLIPHPTGIAYRSGLPVFIGYGGFLYEVDWDLFLEDGVLDRALVRIIADDASRQGTRPEYALFQDQWYLASTEYDADAGNELRLMNLDALDTAEHTSDSSVVAYRAEMPRFIQDLHWSDDLQKLILIRNIILWKGWKMTSLDLEKLFGEGLSAAEATTETTCFRSFRSELEGYANLPDGRDLFLTGDRSNNLFVTDPATFTDRH